MRMDSLNSFTNASVGLTASEKPGILQTYYCLFSTSIPVQHL